MRWQRPLLPVRYLVALLGSQLTADDVSAIADELAESGDPATAESIRAAISRTANVTPDDNDIAGSVPGSPQADGRWPPPNYLDRPTT
ncbi:MAG: hypothetical protein QOH17_3583 [Pseudonocardiales bacterium]|jgi:hypothetical protein|nr:hypothetical protein [Pseudonocardiales bacterium]